MTTDEVCGRLGVDASCETATTGLPGADDPARLDSFVATYGGRNPTDSDVVGAD